MEQLESVRALLENALELLDSIEAPGDIGAHVDLALSRVVGLLENLPAGIRGIAGGPASH